MVRLILATADWKFGGTGRRADSGRRQLCTGRGRGRGRGTYLLVIFAGNFILFSFRVYKYYGNINSIFEILNFAVDFDTIRYIFFRNKQSRFASCFVIKPRLNKYII